MDDIIVGGIDEEDLTKNLIAVFKKLNDGHLKILLSKVQFFESELKPGTKNGKTIATVSGDGKFCLQLYPTLCYNNVSTLPAFKKD